MNNTLKNLKNLKRIALVLFAFFVTSSMYSQVTIGSLKDPETFSLLELVSENSKGLRLPQIETTAQRDSIFTDAEGFASNPLALGLKIFNMETKCAEIWNGTGWISINPSVYTGSTSISLNGTSFERAALTGDVTAQLNSNATVIADNAVTSAKILDGTIVAADLNPMDATANQVLTWNGSVWTPTTPAAGWLLAGNDGTTPGTHFLGTTDDKDIIFKRNGVQAGWLNYSDGNFGNTAFGVAALPTTTTGLLNTAVGYSALSTNSSGMRNTALGHTALSVNTGGSDNTAVGSRALISLGSGGYNTAIGSNAMSNGTSAGSNTAVGSSALQNNTASGNTAVGTDALKANTTANYNTAVGSAVLAKSTGASNTAMGGTAMGENTTGINNVAVGAKALQLNTTGSNNTVLGNSAGGNINGNDNIAIGNMAGNTISSGSFNIAIGSGTMFPNGLADYQLNIGGIIRGTNIGTVTTATTNPGRIGIGTDTPQSTLEVSGAITNTKATDAGTGVNINFALSNLAHSAATSANPAFNCTGLKDGGTYTLAWQSNTAGTATIATDMTTTKMVSSPSKTDTQHIVYSIVCIGTVAYVYPAVF